MLFVCFGDFKCVLWSKNKQLFFSRYLLVVCPLLARTHTFFSICSQPQFLSLFFFRKEEEDEAILVRFKSFCRICANRIVVNMLIPLYRLFSRVSKVEAIVWTSHRNNFGLEHVSKTSDVRFINISNTLCPSILFNEEKIDRKRFSSLANISWKKAN